MYNSWKKYDDGSKETEPWSLPWMRRDLIAINKSPSKGNLFLPLQMDSHVHGPADCFHFLLIHLNVIRRASTWQGPPTSSNFSRYLLIRLHFYLGPSLLHSNFVLPLPRKFPELIWFARRCSDTCLILTSSGLAWLTWIFLDSNKRAFPFVSSLIVEARMIEFSYSDNIW